MSEAVAQANILQESTTPKKTVLVVEDDVFLSNLLSARLQRIGANVLRVADGEEALSALKNNKVDLMLLDIIIPKKSGFELLEEMQKEESLRQVPVIVISNLGQEGDVARGRSFGVKNYLVKARNSIDDITSAAKAFLDGGAVS